MIPHTLAPPFHILMNGRIANNGETGPEREEPEESMKEIRALYA
jgi:hypothetical protein